VTCSIIERRCDALQRSKGSVAAQRHDVSAGNLRLNQSIPTPTNKRLQSPQFVLGGLAQHGQSATIFGRQRHLWHRVTVVRRRLVFTHPWEALPSGSRRGIQLWPVSHQQCQFVATTFMGVCSSTKLQNHALNSVANSGRNISLDECSTQGACFDKPAINQPVEFLGADDHTDD
jgi:hypothetical protein